MMPVKLEPPRSRVILNCLILTEFTFEAPNRDPGFLERMFITYKVWGCLRVRFADLL